MRRISFAVAFLLTLALPAPAQSVAAPDLRIVEILPDPDTAAGQREFVELLNAGNTTVGLAGWRLRDAPTASGATNSFTFPAWSLAPGERVVVWGSGAADAYGPTWSNGAAWNNAGDGVSLLDPAGTVTDWIGYGSATPPAEHPEAIVLAKPDKGRSVAIQADDAWSIGEPSPGLAPGGVGSVLEVDVANAAPAISFQGLPASVRPGSLPIQLVTSDPNGAADLEAWSLTVQGQPAGSGPGAPPATVQVTIPGDVANVLVVATVRDAAGLNGTAQATLPVRASDLELILPADGLGLPSLAPGQSATTQAITVRNHADAARTARLDLGLLRGPVEAALNGLVEVGIQAGNETTWVRYDGPLQPLGSIPSGGEMVFVLRVQVPDGLPAGRYGASLAVVA